MAPGGSQATATQSADLGELPGCHVEDEATDRILVRDEGAGLDPGNRLADVTVDVAERLRRPRRLDPRLILDRAFEGVVGEGQHAAVGVVDQDDLPGAEQALADRE